jgi:type II secretory pathway pseudopilin PulG
MVETLIVVAITIIIAGIAIPIMGNAMKSFQQNASVSAATGAISTTRFQAIMRGYPYQLVFTPSTLSYQVFNEVPPASTFSLVVPATGSSTTPLPAAGGIAMTGETCSVPLTNWACTPTSDIQTISGTTVTYTFSANGTVTTTPSGVGIQIKNSVKSNTIWISGVGNVGTSSP